ncbi:hypothetical protein [Azospirillum himalayense]|uniref:Capsular polysaccharide biosynthesis protein n=1 Tax=Azospirillum himalayense TaxID=654847 RepID=A0ABW0G4Z8_9PROT
MSLISKPRVAILGDLFRSYEEEGFVRWTQRPNVAWLAAIVRAALPDIEVTAITPESLGFDPAGIMAEEELPATPDGWLTSFDRHPTGAVATAMKALRGQFVVGFELPPGLRSALQDAGADVINLAIHPVRCLDDLLFSLQADERIERHFASHAIRMQEMGWKLGRMRARLARERAYAPATSGRAAVLFGQMRIDRSLMAGGRLVSLLDFADRIREIAARHDCLYVRAHPLEAPRSDVLEMLAAIPGVLMTDRNVYELLDAPDVVSVCAISSSVLYEAGLFNKPAEAFIPHPDFGLPPIPRGLALDLDGFARGLSALVGTPPQRFEQAPGALREVVGQNWGLTPAATGPLHRRPPVLPNREVCLADAEMKDARLCGWRVHADWGLWSVGAHAVLEFRWPESITDPIPVACRLMAGPSHPSRRPTLTIVAGGEVVHKSDAIGFNDPVTITFEVRPPARGDRFQVHIFSSDPQAPQEIGLNDDSMPLGAACFSLHRC